jgi:beta-N-acetylglucosaminidase
MDTGVKNMKYKHTKLLKKIKSTFTAAALTVVFTASIFGSDAPVAFAAAVDSAGENDSNQDEDDTWLAETAEYVEEVVDEARESLRELASEQSILAVTYMCDTLKVHEQPSEDSNTVVTVQSGQTVLIEDADIEILDKYYSEWKLWLYVSFYYNNREYRGYIPSTNIVSSDERFISWKSDSGLDPESSIATYSLEETQSISYADIEQFPESYRAALKALKDEHPSWVFVPYNTGLDWDTVIVNEIGGSKSLVYKTFDDCMKEGLYDSGSWYYASEAILKYYIDPRNSLTENTIFQFEQLTYNESYHTKEAVSSFLSNTFMSSSKGNAPGTSKTFAEIFWEVGKEKNVSPFHLASRVYQEQGDGTSALISGTYQGYLGFYNYFNVGASGKTTTEVIESGLKYAKDKSWNNAETSITGGAETISTNYIAKGQDTVYLQKFNVTSNNTYGHQYMQNISAPTTEAATIMKQYDKAGALDSTFVFKIPVYNNMPQTACAKPTSSTNVVLKIPSGYSSTIYVDGISYTGVSRNGQMIVTLPNGSATNAVVYEYNESGVPMGMYLWTLQYKNNAYVVTAQPELEDLLTYHGFSIRITGKTGIRYKTGISQELRNKLTSGGVNGYVLKEYGTLVMNNANTSTYPMIKGGEKVASGMSYGINANGALEDKIYETVSGRLRFTSVLVGLPAEQYKTEYAFRGYAVLEKDGKQITVYGPVMARSMYSLAEQVLGMGTYSEGSDAYNFLKNIVDNAK